MQDKFTDIRNNPTGRVIPYSISKADSHKNSVLICSPDARITAISIKQGQACTGTEHLHSLTLRRYSGSLGQGF